MKRARINIRTAANGAAIRRETRDGRAVIVVPSATLPDGVVMNRIRYPAAAIEAGYRSLEGKPAPLGHPMLNGKFLSASDPRGMVRGFVGAWNENLRREGGRVLLDKVIDVEFAKRAEGGAAVLAAVEKGEPIHTSTGLYCTLTSLQNDADADFEAADLVFDHDAILIGEDGAATPEQGVGIFVNAKGEPSEVLVVNSFLEDAERELDWAVKDVARAVDRLSGASRLERIKQSLLEIFKGAQHEEDPMSVTKEQFEGLSQKVDALAASFEAQAPKIAEMAANSAVKALTEAHAAEKAKAEEAELSELRAKHVANGRVSEADAALVPLPLARSLVKAATPGKAAALNSAPPALKTGEGEGFKLPEAK